ncbi:MAG: MBL fold metallo-hydrolase [Nitrospiraceae bacterium]
MVTVRSASHGRLELHPADRVEVLVLVDNATDLLSTNPENVQSELRGLLRAGMRELAGEAVCCAHHGLSLIVSAYHNGARRTMLFDAGPEGFAIERNGGRLAVDFGSIEAVVLSHGHYDHCGGALKALDLITAGQNRNAPVYVHPDMFRVRALRLTNGDVLPLKNIPTVEELTTNGASIVNSSEAQSLLDGLFYVSGEIPRLAPYERGLPNHLCRMKANADWEPDPWIMDERWLAVQVKRKGLVVFTACSHAGVVNVLTHARDRFPDIPLYAVVGGFHLSGAGPEDIIPDTITDLAQFGLRMIVPGHCTGWRAVTALVARFGEKVVVPSAVGKLLSF